jgi:hypothetical protein
MLSSLLDRTGDHLRATSTDDGALGTDRTWATQAAGFPCAVWPAGSAEARTFYSRDLIGDHLIATDRDLGVKAKDRILVSGVYYLVNGFQSFANAAVSAETCYLVDASKRTGN